ncbi:MAG: single-stranded-DNA-specific exonuclease RecJ [Opitutales bacterium]
MTQPAPRWTEPACSPADRVRLARELACSEVVAGVLLAAGFSADAVDEVAAFYDPRLKALADPLAVTGMPAVVRRLRAAITGGEDVLILGDYDVDGVTSTALMVSLLRTFGLEPRYTVPRRLDEGYGLTEPVLERILAEGAPDLLICLDCGTNAGPLIGNLQGRGIDVLVVDHHQAKAPFPAGALLINPHVRDPEGVSWKDLCTVGLAFKVAHALIKVLRAEGDPVACRTPLKPVLDLVALGTIADLVPLRGENRILARHGLRCLQTTRRCGLHALFEASGIQDTATLSAGDVAFRLGPRINASGRLDDARIPVDMLLAQRYEVGSAAAGKLNRLNGRRQAIERTVARAAEEQVRTALESAATGESLPPAGCVLFDPSWHPGVLGIVAGRLSRQFNRPVIVLGGEDGEARGSGRSVPGADLVTLLKPCASLLTHWGGHPMAAGVTLPEENVPAFRQAFESAVRTAFPDPLPGRPVELAAWLQPEKVTPALMDELDRLQPFGQANPEPVFGLPGVVLPEPPKLFGSTGDHLRFGLRTSSGGWLNVVAWGQASNPPPSGCPVDLAVRLEWNVWNGRKDLQLVLQAWRLRG